MWEFIDTKPFHDHLNSLRWLQKAASWLRWTAVGALTWCFFHAFMAQRILVFRRKLETISIFQEFEFIVLVTLLDHWQLPSCDITMGINSRYKTQLSDPCLLCASSKGLSLHNFIKYMLSGCLIKPCVSGLASNNNTVVLVTNWSQEQRRASFWLPTPSKTLGCHGVFWGLRGVIRRVWCCNRRGVDC